MNNLEQWEDVDSLRTVSTKIQYFGLGFVQVKCGVEQRLHYYHPELPVTVAEESAHNHRYNFVSKVLKGLLEQELFSAKAFQTIPTHKVSQESCEPGDRNSGQVALAVVSQAKFWLPTGTEYWLAHQQLHRVKAIGKTITAITRPLEHAVAYADVATPINQVKVCPFESSLSEDQLWEYVSDTLN